MIVWDFHRTYDVLHDTNFPIFFLFGKPEISFYLRIKGQCTTSLWSLVKGSGTRATSTADSTTKQHTDTLMESSRMLSAMCTQPVGWPYEGTLAPEISEAWCRRQYSSGICRRVLWYRHQCFGGYCCLSFQDRRSRSFITNQTLVSMNGLLQLFNFKFYARFKKKNPKKKKD